MTTGEIIEYLMDLGWNTHLARSVIDGKQMIELTYTHGTDRGSIMARGRGETAAAALQSVCQDMRALLDIISRVEV